METIAQRETRITRAILIVVLTIYLMVFYNEIKKGFVEGYKSYTASNALYGPSCNCEELEILPNRYIL